jgi:HD superfamily phosphohydrolase
MEELNLEYNGSLDLAIDIFTNNYSKAYLHQLISSQLDMDRLDYLRRDSFYSGVTEGQCQFRAFTDHAKCQRRPACC